jgi:hypothetical protein
VPVILVVPTSSATSQESHRREIKPYPLHE